MKTTEIKAMDRAVVEAIIRGIKGGTATRVTYFSFPKLKAESKRNGVEIMKVTSTTVRVGVDYTHLDAVQKYKAEHETAHYDRPDWVNDESGRFVFIPKTNNTLVRVYKMPKHSNTKSYYIITDKNGTRAVDELSDEEKAYIIDSYFKEASADEVKKNWEESTQKINIDKFIEIKVNT